MRTHRPLCTGEAFKKRHDAIRPGAVRLSDCLTDENAAVEQVKRGRRGGRGASGGQGGARKAARGK